jgi:thiol-disulfide isomerase/thioredoxin
MTIRNEISKVSGGKVGSKALDFTLGTIDGGRVSLSEYYEKGYTLLDFWASWCVPCIGEIPKVRELHNKYGDILQVLSI